MALCSSRDHAQLPQTVVHLSVIWCHSCQAWRVYLGRCTYDGHDEIAYDAWDEHNLGPFDGPLDVLHIAVEGLESALLGPGRPWDPSAA